MSNSTYRIIFFSVLVLALSVSAKADSLWLSGGEWSEDNSYAYVGVVLPLTGDRIDQGLVQRYWLDRLTYSYDNSADTVDAEAWGIEASLGYQFSSGSSWGGAYLGLLFRDTHLSPDDSDNDSRGGKLAPKASAQMDLGLTSTKRIELLGSYVFNQSAYWTRLRFSHVMKNDFKIGPEFVAHGDREYQVLQAGVFVSGIRLTDEVTLGCKLGIQIPDDQPSQAYVGIELSSWF